MRTSAARRREDLALAAGLAVLALALGPWFDRLSDARFAWHMLQHVLIMLVAAPLLLLGGPLRRLLAALPQRAARKLHAIFAFIGSPVPAWLAFALALYVTHFSPLYEAALDHPGVHAFEHGLLLSAALVFWNPILAVAPVRPLPFPARVLYVFVAMPIGAFLALALYTTSHPMYAYYEQRLGWGGALADQEYGGEIMWLAGGSVLFVALMLLVARWLRDERRKALLADRYR